MKEPFVERGAVFSAGIEYVKKLEHHEDGKS